MTAGSVPPFRGASNSLETGRASGILLHPTSLPGPNGVGELGPEALRFANWLAAARQTIWQMLPLGPVGYGESPYQLFSAFAGNPLLVSLDVLLERGWLDKTDLASRPPGLAADSVAFERVGVWKNGLLRLAHGRFVRHALPADRAEFEDFATSNRGWLDSYAYFMALKEAHGGVSWVEWEPGAVPAEDEINFHKFVQWEFFRQWRALRLYCAGLGIRLMGDVPIYVAHDSADVWAHRDLFWLDEAGRPLVVAGVPPDYFSATGQLWGNPIYRWDRLAKNGYQWWIDRMSAALKMFDLVRMDHFRGFEAFWEVPAPEQTAIRGRWVKGPGSDLFRRLKVALGGLPLVAENLGVITPEVEGIRREFGLPGMAILQFAFGNDAQAPDFKPHNYERNLVAYTGTHDNDTVLGWWRSEGGDSVRSAEDINVEKSRAMAYLDTDGRDMNWTMIRTLMASVAGTVLFPMQDVLGLGSEARMNTPAVAGGNWRWRMPSDALTPELAERLATMAALYERDAGRGHSSPSPADQP